MSILRKCWLQKVPATLNSWFHATLGWAPLILTGRQRHLFPWFIYYVMSNWILSLSFLFSLKLARRSPPSPSMLPLSLLLVLSLQTVHISYSIWKPIIMKLATVCSILKQLDRQDPATELYCRFADWFRLLCWICCWLGHRSQQGWQVLGKQN